jgi:cytochrome c5
MLKPLLLLPAALLLYAGFSPAPQKPQKPAPQQPQQQVIGVEPARGEPAVRAKEIYGVDCAICHNANGDGKADLGKSLGVTSDWTDPKSLEGKSDQHLFDAIRKGTDKMPPEDAGRANDAEVKALVKYIRDFSKGQPAPAAEPAAPAPSNPPSTN